MHIDSIRNGIVLDHIRAGKAMEIYRFLGLDALDCSVAIIKNAPSKKQGKKDIIKIDSEMALDLNILGFIDPRIKSTYKGVKKKAADDESEDEDEEDADEE